MNAWIIAALVWGHDLFFSVSRGGGGSPMPWASTYVTGSDLARYVSDT